MADSADRSVEIVDEIFEDLKRGVPTASSPHLERLLERLPEDLHESGIRRLIALCGQSGVAIDLGSLLTQFPAHADAIREERGRAISGIDHSTLASHATDSPTSDQWEQLIASLKQRDSSSRYRINGKLGQGGMGEVYRIRDKDLDRELAMKVLRSSTDDESAANNRRRRFVEEARITGQLDHPGIVPIHDIGVGDDGRVYFTMPRVKGQTLSEILDCVEHGEGDWNQPRILGILLKVCEALSYAHSKMVIHRDLKPANVMVGRFGEVYLMDWGLARIVDQTDFRDIRPNFEMGTLALSSRPSNAADTDEPLFTMDGDLIGTPAYMSPEQARGDVESVGARSDVYGMGAMLYQVLTGQMPYVPRRGKISPHMIIRWVLDSPPRSIHQIRKDVAPELVSICDKAMARDPDERYQSMPELARDLRAFLEGRVVRAHESGAFAELRKWIARNTAIASLLLALLTLGILGIVGGTYYRAKSTQVVKTREALARETQVREQLAIEAERTTAANNQLKQASLAREAALETQTQTAISLAAETERKEAALKKLEKTLTRRDAENSATQLIVDSQSEPPGTALLLRLEAAKTLPFHVVNSPLYEALRDLHEDTTLVGHTGAVYSIDARGDLMVSSGRSIWVWNLKTQQHYPVTSFGTEIYRFVRFLDDKRILACTKGNAYVFDIASTETQVEMLDAVDRIASIFVPGSASFAHFDVSPDGSHVALATTKGALWLWDINSNTQTTIQAHDAIIHDVKFSRSGEWVATASQDGTSRVWKVADNATEPIHTLQLEDDDADHRALQFSPDDERLAVGIASEHLAEWATKDGQLIRSVNIERTGWITEVKYSQDGQLIVAPSMGSITHLWRDDDAVSSLRNQARSESAEFSPDGSTVAICGFDWCTRIWDVADERLVHELRGHEGMCLNVVWLNNKQLATTSDDGTVRLWTLDNESFPSLPDKDTLWFPSCWHPNGDSALAIRRYNEPAWVIWDLVNDATERRLPDVQRLENVSLAVSHFTNVVAVGADTEVYLYDIDTQDSPKRLIGHAGHVTTMVFTADDQRLMTASYGREQTFFYPGRDRFADPDPTARLWDTQNGELIHELKGHSLGILCAAVDTTGGLAITGSKDDTALVWDLESGTALHTLNHDTDVVFVEFVDSQRIVTVSGAMIRVWDLTTGETTAELRGHQRAIQRAALSANKDTLVTASPDGTCRAWSVSAREQIAVFTQHSGDMSPRFAEIGPFYSLSISKDGKIAVSCSVEDGIRVWDTHNANQLLHISEWGIMDAQLNRAGDAILYNGVNGLSVCPVDCVREAKRRAPRDISLADRSRYGLAGALQPTNLGFEVGVGGSFPPGWSQKPPIYTAADSTVTTTEEQPFEGQRCASLRREINRNSAWGNLVQTVDATPYHGKRLRLTAAVRVAPESGEENYKAQLWLRADPGKGSSRNSAFFDNMGDRPIRSTEWSVHSIEADVKDDVEWIHFGVIEFGAGTTYVDAFSIEVVDE